MKRINLFVFFLFTFLAAYAQKEKAYRYIETYKDFAIAEMKRSGVPASITLAQGMLESGYGESNLCKKSNNHFGIKCKENWTGEKTYHDDDEKGECFRVYPSAAESYKDHSDFLRSRPWYASLFKLDPTDYEGWAHGLKKAGYATESKYPQLLIKVINDYNLQQYTLLALNKTAPKEEVAVIAHEEEGYKPAKEIIATSIDAPDAKEDDVVLYIANPEAPKPSSTSLFPKTPFVINQTKVMYVEEGTSLLAIAEEYKVSLKKLLEFNELSDNTEILAKGQLIFLQKKQKKGSKDIHVVEINETLYDISQKEGIQLDVLLAFNRIPKGNEPAAGEKIYLRGNSPVTPKLLAAK